MDRFDRWIRDLLDSGNGWWIVALLFVLVTLLFSAAARGEPFAFSAVDPLGNKVSLYKRPCELPKVIASAAPEWRDKLQDGLLMYRGRHIKGCWALAGDGQVYFMDEEMDLSVIPVTEFRPDEGV